MYENAPQNTVWYCKLLCFYCVERSVLLRWSKLLISPRYHGFLNNCLKNTIRNQSGSINSHLQSTNQVLSKRVFKIVEHGPWSISGCYRFRNELNYVWNGILSVHSHVALPFVKLTINMDIVQVGWRRKRALYNSRKRASYHHIIVLIVIIDINLN